VWDETQAVARPATFELIGDQLAVRWENGHESFYRPEDLRAHCPCALCKTQRAKTQAQQPDPLRLLTPEQAEGAAMRILAYEPVGRYAVRFIWEDRHDTGIYDFRLLRSICPCEACR